MKMSHCDRCGAKLVPMRDTVDVDGWPVKLVKG